MKKEKWDATAKKQVLTDEDEQINQASALWARPKSEITEEQYHEFYKHVAHDFEPPLAHVHAKVEGRQEYTQLFFIPQRAPFDLWDRDAPPRHQALRPARLHHGRRRAADADVPAVRARHHRLDRSAAERLARDPAAVARRAEDQGGVDQARARPARGPGRRSSRRSTRRSGRPSAACSRKAPPRTWRTASGSRSCCALRRRTTGARSRPCRWPTTSRRMKEGQEAIYYITADSFAAARNSPHLEIFRKLGVEVLLMYDRIDEWVVSLLTEFEGKPLQSVAKGDLDLSKLGGEAATEEEKPGEDEPGAPRADAGGAEGSRQRRAHHRAADRFAGVPRQRRARHEHASRADAEGRRPERAPARSRSSRSIPGIRSSSA